MRKETKYILRSPEGERVIAIAHTTSEDPDEVLATYLREGEQIVQVDEVR